MLAVFKIAIVTAVRGPEERAGLDVEGRDITDKIRRSAYRDAIEIVHVPAGRTDDLIGALLRHRPQVVHFVGQGTSGLLFAEGNDGERARPVTADALAGVFAALPGVRLVFLSASYSRDHARAVTAHVDYAIGMGRQVMAEAAARFAASFYMTIGYGESVQAAFAMARAALMLEQVPESSAPRLELREGADAAMALVGPGGAVAAHPPLTVPAAGSAVSAARAGLPVELPERLRRDLEPVRERLHASPNAVLPVVGSDLSPLPSWDAFLEQLIALTPDDLAVELRDMLAKDKYLDVADLLEGEPTVGPTLIAEHIRQTYQRRSSEASTAPAVYDLIAALPPTHFATTHYDPWLKIAVNRRYPGARVYAPRDPGAFSHIEPTSDPLVLMLHGDADRPEHCVLSQRSYGALMHRGPEYRAALASLAATRAFLFIGHGLDNPDLLAVLEEWRQVFSPERPAARHWFLGVDLTRATRHRLGRLGVLPIEYGTRGDHSLLPAVLQFLARKPGDPAPGEAARNAAQEQARQAAHNAKATAKQTAARMAHSLAAYGRWARREFGHVGMAGVGRGKLRLSLDDVFVPLHFARAPGRPGHLPGHISGLTGDDVRQADMLGDDPDCWPDGRPGAHTIADLGRAFPAVAPARHLFILGDPGSGKTTALRKLLWSAVATKPADGSARAGGASNAAGSAAATPHGFDGLALGLGVDTVPVFLRLRQLDVADLAKPLAAFVDARLAALGVPEIGAGLGRWLWERGNLLLLLDGLDEVADPALRAEVCAYIDDQLERARADGAASIRAAVSCRFAGRSRGVGFGASFATLEIRPLDDRQIETLTSRWFAAAEQSLATAPHGSSADDLAAAREHAYQHGFERGVALAQTLASPNHSANHSARRVMELVANPLLLTLLCVVVFDNHEIPKKRVVFFRDCLRTLLSRWGEAQSRRPPLLPLEDALTLLGELAWTMHERARKELDGPELREVLQPAIDRLNGKLRRHPRLTYRQVVTWLVADTGALSEFARDEFGFMHLSLQEYLAAQRGATLGLAGAHALADRFGEAWWREVLLLFVALPEHTLFGALIERVVAGDLWVSETECQDLIRACLDEAHAPDIAPLLAAVTIEPADEQDPEHDTDQVYARRTAALKLLQHRDDDRVREAAARVVASDSSWTPGPGQPTPTARAELVTIAARVAGVALEHVARPGRPWRETTTGIRFLWIPGGVFRMGLEAALPGWKQYDAWAMPAHPVAVSPLWLGETPVTNAQYERFVVATGHEEPESWRDRQLNAPDQPVVMVHWDDAMAFCAWLSQVSGQGIVLPSEAQWEFAARGPEGRMYPWGDEEPDESRANVANKRGATTPVGEFPAGVGPFGTLDQAGNVWEWCRDAFADDTYARRAGGRPVVDPVGPEGADSPRAEARAVRGGSWFDHRLARDLRAAYRCRGHRRLRGVSLGFRVAATPAARILDP